MAGASKTRRLSSPPGTQPVLKKRGFPEKSAFWLLRACPRDHGASPALVSLFLLLREARESGWTASACGLVSPMPGLGILGPQTGFSQSGAETLHPHLCP